MGGLQHGTTIRHLVNDSITDLSSTIVAKTLKSAEGQSTTGEYVIYQTAIPTTVKLSHFISLSSSNVKTQ
jgi:hypothetical protein